MYATLRPRQGIPYYPFRFKGDALEVSLFTSSKGIVIPRFKLYAYKLLHKGFLYSTNLKAAIISS